MGSVHFRGDTLFTNQYRFSIYAMYSIMQLHRLNDERYVSFYRLFSKNMSLKHDDDISHIILTSFVCTILHSS